MDQPTDGREPLDPVRETERFRAALATARELVETFAEREAALTGPIRD